LVAAEQAVNINIDVLSSSKVDVLSFKLRFGLHQLVWLQLSAARDPVIFMKLKAALKTSSEPKTAIKTK